MDFALILEWSIKSIVLILALLVGFGYLTYYERRFLAALDDQDVQGVLAGTEEAPRIGEQHGPVFPGGRVRDHVARSARHGGHDGTARPC